MNYKIARRGIMLVLSSPSGAGKTSIATNLLNLDKICRHQFRSPHAYRAPGEIDGQDYFFVTHEIFENMLQEDAFLEYARVFGHYYGTPKSFVFDMLTQGRDIIFDIDWQGTQQLAQMARTDLVSVFILPPSTKELENRLRGRNQDSEAVVEKRMWEAANEMSHWAEYDYVLVNRNLTESTAMVQSILMAERLKRTRQLGLIDFVNVLRKDHQDLMNK